MDYKKKTVLGRHSLLYRELNLINKIKWVLPPFGVLRQSAYESDLSKGNKLQSGMFVGADCFLWKPEWDQEKKVCFVCWGLWWNILDDQESIVWVYIEYACDWYKHIFVLGKAWLGR